MTEMNLFDMSADDSTLDVFEAKKSNNDGIYRPKLEDATDKAKGYKAIIRFLPNWTPENKMGVTAIEKHLHYANIQSNSALSGYYDCGKSDGGKTCDMCNEYWKLFNSKNAADNEKAKLISRSTKYYSYVLVIDDQQQPELNGKILVFPYGKQISKKIQEERKGEITDDPCNVFDLGQGKDFVLLIKEKSNFPTYEGSSFRPAKSSLKIPAKDGSLKAVPTDANGKVSDAKVQKAIIEFLSGRDVQLEEHAAKSWDDEIKGKVQDIISILEGRSVSNENAATTSTDPFGDTDISDTPDDFGGDTAADAGDFFTVDTE